MNPYTNYGAGLAQTPSAPPSVRLPVNRGLLSWLLLSMVTFGIYPIVALANISSEVNLVASNRDRLHTTNGVLVFLLAFPTLGIYPFVWWHKISDRIGGELRARGVDYSFDAGSFWLWGVFGSLFCGLGSLVFIHKFTTAMNRLNEHYNANGTSYPVAAAPGPFQAASVFPASSSAALPPAGFVGSSATPILPVSSSGSGRAPRAAAILLAVGSLLGLALTAWWLVEWRLRFDFDWELERWWSWCLFDAFEHGSSVLFLVGAFLLVASRFGSTRSTACLWFLSALCMVLAILFPFVSRLLAQCGLYLEEVSFDSIPQIGMWFFAGGIFVAGILLLARRPTGVMSGLFVAAAGLLVSVLNNACNFFEILFGDYQSLFQLSGLRWAAYLLSVGLRIAGLVVLALAAKKADWADRGDMA